MDILQVRAEAPWYVSNNTVQIRIRRHLDKLDEPILKTVLQSFNNERQKEIGYVTFDEIEG